MSVETSPEAIPIRAWKACLSSELVYIVDRGPSAEKVNADFHLALQQHPWCDPHDFVTVDGRCAISPWFVATVLANEEEWVATVFAVAGEALRRLEVTVSRASDFRNFSSEKVLVEGLVPVEDPKTLLLLYRILVPGGDQEFEIEGGFRIAHAALRDRVRSLGHPLDRALLSALVKMALLYLDEGGSKVFDAALQSFAAGCRLAAFDGPMPQTSSRITAAKSLRPSSLERKEAIRSFAVELGTLESKLHTEAVEVEWSGKIGAARYLQAAAQCVAQARELLDEGEDAVVPAGKPHRALCDLEVIVRDYDSISRSWTALAAGEVFQPWQPLAHWRGKYVPITFGELHNEFDWGKTSFEGHFLRWDDFFEKSQATE